MADRGLLLVNLGTPDAPSTPEVRAYLREFLMDPRVLDVPLVKRGFIVNAFILPSRPRMSAEAYRKIWTERGSPLLVHGRDLVEKLSGALEPGVQVELAMRYGSPSIAAALDRFRESGVDRITVFPLFPQYSSSAWGSAIEKVFVEAARRWNVPFLQVIPPFYDHPAFLDAFAAIARDAIEKHDPQKVLMSFHGLPERQIRKSDESGGRHCLQSGSCCDRITQVNRHCYRAQCFVTARGIAGRLGLSEGQWEVAFQSRLGREPWIRPYTDETIVRYAAAGVKRVAVICPAFVADCLETLEEIGLRAREDFRSHGGDDLCLVPSLNSDDCWVKAVLGIVLESGAAG